MEFPRDIRRNKEILIRRSKSSKNTPHSNTSRRGGARKQLSFNGLSDNISEERAGAPSSGATSFYGQGNPSNGSEGRTSGLNYGAPNLYGQQRYTY